MRQSFNQFHLSEFADNWQINYPSMHSNHSRAGCKKVLTGVFTNPTEEKWHSDRNPVVLYLGWCVPRKWKIILKAWNVNSLNSHPLVCDGSPGYLSQYLNVTPGISFITHLENTYPTGHSELGRVNPFCCIPGGILLIWDSNGGPAHLF